MSLDDLTYSDDKGHHIKIDVTPEMRTAVVRLLEADQNATAANQLQDRKAIALAQNVYAAAVEILHKKTYEANPHLDPSTWRQEGGNPMTHIQREDMKVGINDTLNALIEEMAAKEGITKPGLLKSRARE